MTNDVAERTVAAAIVGPKRSVAERFGVKPNPFGVKAGRVVGRTDEFRRIAALPRRTTWVNLAAALTMAMALPPRKPNTCPALCPCGQTGRMALRPLQAWALSEFYQQRGGIGLLGVGTGKTIVSALLPTLMEAESPVLYVPAGLRHRTLENDFPLLARHWVMHENLEVLSYESLSRDYDEYLGVQKIPDLIIGDECHALRSRSSGRSKKMTRHLRAHPDTACVWMTGSIVHRSTMDYGHLFGWGLKDKSPLPESIEELKTWSDLMDDSVPDYMRPDPGAMLDFCVKGETPRDGYRRRLLESAGIVSSSDLSTDIPLDVYEIPHPPLPKEVVNAFHLMRNTAELPGGEMATTALDQTRHARELFLGFYLKWDWPGGKPDLEWLRKRRLYRKYVRKMTTRSHKGVWTDTEAQVVMAVRDRIVTCNETEYDPKLKDENGDPKVIRTDVNVLEEWEVIREDRQAKWGDQEPPKKVVWLSDYMLRAVEQWAMEHTGDKAGIVWIENRGFLAELKARQHTRVIDGKTVPGHGCECFGPGGKEASRLEQSDGARSVFSSLAHKRGTNLQMFSYMLFTNPIPSGDATEQALGREHRARQKAAKVTAEVFLGCRETWWSFERARADAKYIESTLGQPQRLNMATITSTAEAIVLERCDRGEPAWAETGHAKIDGKLGRVIGVDADGNDIREASATPLLTQLRQEAKKPAPVDVTDSSEDDDSDAENEDDA